MRSRELADLASVTVRTLRHYHQIGLLPEPSRSPNGYRTYTAEDLVRLLRIRHLVELGVGLAEITGVLDGDAEVSPTAMLDRMEAGIDVKIADLEAQRALIRTLRARGGATDAPVGLAGDLAELHDTAGVSPAAARFDLDVATVIVQLSGLEVDAVREAIVDLRERAGPAFFAAVNRLAEMPPGASTEQRQRTADELRANVPALPADGAGTVGSTAAAVLAELEQLRLNHAQLDTLSRSRGSP